MSSAIGSKIAGRIASSWPLGFRVTRTLRRLVRQDRDRCLNPNTSARMDTCLGYRTLRNLWFSSTWLYSSIGTPVAHVKGKLPWTNTPCAEDAFLTLADLKHAQRQLRRSQTFRGNASYPPIMLSPWLLAAQPISIDPSISSADASATKSW